MKHFSKPAAALGLMAALLVPGPALAGPGHDHGHDHGHAPGAAAPAGTTPVLTATSEAFELVGRLKAGELSIHIDRAATNEPVLGAELSVESDGRRATVPFHADQGDYAVDDPALLAHLKAPGVKTLVFTLRAGDESELLAAELDLPPDAHADDAAQGPAWTGYAGWAAVAAAALLVLRIAGRRLARTRQAREGAAA